MVKYKRDGTVIKITAKTSVGWTITTEYECGSELYAVLLLESLERGDQLYQESEHKDWYNKGWKDKAKRNRKQTNFKIWF